MLSPLQGCGLVGEFFVCVDSVPGRVSMSVELTGPKNHNEV
jgi:hypothetical protein